MYIFSSRKEPKFLLYCTIIVLMLVLVTLQAEPLYSTLTASPIEHTFQQAASDFGVPEDLLKALCYMEGRFSMHGGAPSSDGGYGCNLTKNNRVDTLDSAAHKLGVSTTKLQHDLQTNIRGAAYILSEDARQLSQTHTLPFDLAGWQGALELYSNSLEPDITYLYANAVYMLLKRGFSALTEQGDVIIVAPTPTPMQTSQPLHIPPVKTSSHTLPSANNISTQCRKDGRTDYPGAVDCILRPSQHDCDLVPGANSPCNYFSSSRFSPLYRQKDHTITHIVIHDIEGTVKSAIHTFEVPTSEVSSHYIVNSDGTIYQIVREKDVAFHAGNFWYNQHSIGIEHAGYDTTGFLWYNATMYLASARLVAYLLNKYHIPLDHDHIVAHGTVPALSLVKAPNHVDPGAYWLWDYYLNLICKRQACAEIPFVFQSGDSHIFALHPQTNKNPFERNGTETPANFNFFYLYKGPSTQSGFIPQDGNGSDITDESNTVETNMSYYYVNKAEDAAGTGDEMYEIWYGEANEIKDTSDMKGAKATPHSFYTHAKLAWLAVPPEAAVAGVGTAVKLISSDGFPIHLSGEPGANTKTSNYYIGDAPNGSIFVSGYTATEDGTNNIWYSINYNHRQAWVPAYNIIVEGKSTPLGAPWSWFLSYALLETAVFLLGLQLLLALLISRRKSVA